MNAPLRIASLALSTLSLCPAALSQGTLGAELLRGGCADTVRDANTGACLEAAVDAAVGQLFPLSFELFVNPSTRFVGMRTLNPLSPLHIADARAGTGLTTVFIQNFIESGTGLFVTSTDDTGGTSNFGIRASAGAHNGTGVAGYNRSGTFVTATGVSGSTAGGGSGVAGVGVSADDDNNGVYGLTNSETVGRGVWGIHFSAQGTGAGVDGRTYSTSSNAAGVYGETVSMSPGSNSAAVRGRSRGTGSQGIGVFGSQNGTGSGVYGETAGAGVGVLGSAPSPGFAVYGNGDTGCSGTKSFVQPHPSDPSKEIRFVSLEGNESGTYFRGTGRIVDGRATIDVPEDFQLVSEPTSITVQVTGIGRGELWIESKGLERIEVGGEHDIEFDYFVNGLRRGLADFRTIRENRSFVPLRRGEPYRAPEHVKQLMVENGSLNADHTPNEATAYRNGWELADPIQEPASPATDLPQVRELP